MLFSGFRTICWLALVLNINFNFLLSTAVESDAQSCPAECADPEIAMGNQMCSACVLTDEPSAADLEQRTKFTILGGGNAAGYLAKALVEKGLGKGELVIITEEDALPYERPALSKAFLTNENVRLPGFHTCVGSGNPRQDKEWYEDHGIEVMTGTEVTEVDQISKTLIVSDGHEVPFKNLIIATGAVPIQLTSKGSTLEGIHYLRNVADGLHLVEGIKACKSESTPAVARGKAVVVGGGYIGMEVAAQLSLNGIETTMVFPDNGFLVRLFPEKVADMYENYYKKKGIKILKKGPVVKAFEGGADGKLERVVLSTNQRLNASLAVIGVGARPRTDLFREGLLMDPQHGGIVVDGHMRTSEEGVWAIGDVASFPLLRYGRTTRMEHVQHARDSATHLAEVLMSKEQVGDYDYTPYFYSRVFDLAWKFYGDAVGEPIVIGNMDPYILCIWLNQTGQSTKISGVFLESGSDDSYSDVIKSTAQKSPVLKTTQLEELKACKKVEDALAILGQISQVTTSKL